MLTHSLISRLILRQTDTERPKINLSSRDCSHVIYDNGQKRIFEFLMRTLRLHIISTEATSISYEKETRNGFVNGTPSDNVFSWQIASTVWYSWQEIWFPLACIDKSFGTFSRQRKYIHDKKALFEIFHAWIPWLQWKAPESACSSAILISAITDIWITLNQWGSDAHGFALPRSICYLSSQKYRVSSASPSALMSFSTSNTRRACPAFILTSVSVN